MKIPTTWNTLQEFAQWYTDNKYPIRVPENARVFVTDVSYSCCIFRHDCYQVEIYLGSPNFISSKHYHPFDQLIIFLGGHLAGTRGTETTKQPYRESGQKIHENSSAELPHKDAYKIGSVLTTDQWHEVCSFDQGFIFLNCQKWYDKTKMTSAVVEYNGDPLGSLHQDLIKSWQDIPKNS